MLLADLGADVVKVEAPSGDVGRQLGPSVPAARRDAWSAQFESLNRGKRSIILDLTTREGVDTLLALVSEADVLAESYEAGTMEKFGLAYERLRGMNPRLVYASTRCFGDPRTGRPGDYSGSAIVLEAVTRLRQQAAIEDGAGGVGPGIGDIIPGALTALGVVSAVLHARATGQGQYVDVSVYDSALSLCERIAYDGSLWSEDAHPFAVLPSHDGWVPILSDPQASEPLVLRGRPISFSTTPAGPGARAPRLDEHGDEIRAEIAPDHGPPIGRLFEGLAEA
jgi:crotonobetainyl-CoA:carnitine CoA-transferase CaiB-like acyl-CoA transferase